MFRIIIHYLLLINTCFADFFLNHINHMEFYKNRTRPSKAFSSFSMNYLNHNVVRPGRPGSSGSGAEEVQCGTRTVDFSPRRTGKIVGGAETPYGAYPWQVNRLFSFCSFNFRGNFYLHICALFSYHASKFLNEELYLLFSATYYYGFLSCLCVLW